MPNWGAKERDQETLKKLNSLLPLMKSNWKEAREGRRSLGSLQSHFPVHRAGQRMDLEAKGGYLAFPPYLRLVMFLT